MYKKKLVKILVIASAITIVSSFSAFAGWEQQSDSTWKYKDDNTQQYVTARWIENNSEQGLWYYIKADGIMAINTTVDGVYYVNELGEWRESTGGSNENTKNDIDMDSWLNEDGTVYWIPDDANVDTDAGWGVEGVIVG